MNVFADNNGEQPERTGHTKGNAQSESNAHFLPSTAYISTLTSLSVLAPSDMHAYGHACLKRSCHVYAIMQACPRAVLQSTSLDSLHSHEPACGAPCRDMGSIPTTGSTCHRPQFTQGRSPRARLLLPLTAAPPLCCR
jgi:hypothetical protein